MYLRFWFRNTASSAVGVQIEMLTFGPLGRRYWWVSKRWWFLWKSGECVPPGCTLGSLHNVNVALVERTLGEREKNTSKLPLLSPLRYPSWVLTAHWGVSTAVSSAKPCVISKGHTDCPDYGNFKPSEIWSYVLASLLSYVIFEDKPGFAVNCKDVWTSDCLTTAEPWLYSVRNFSVYKGLYKVHWQDILLSIWLLDTISF